MGVKLWMRKYAQQNLNRFPPANGGYAGGARRFRRSAREFTGTNILSKTLDLEFTSGVMLSLTS